ncbi:MAG TPA: arylsulfatase [Lacipirellula sp.]
MQCNRRAFLSACFFAILTPIAAGANLSPAPRPNIIVILSDDMGFSDLGCYGGEINTPHLDALAADGLRFTQFYNAARCCPTRASLLTGVYPHQANMGHMTGGKHNVEGPHYSGQLSDRCLTLAEALRPAGYRTYMTGKWHLAGFNKPAIRRGRVNWPLQRGVDRYYGTIKGGGSFFDPTGLVRNNKPISPFADPKYRPDGEYYYTDAISDHAARFIADHAREHEDQPFFMYVAYTAAHWPMHAKTEDMAKYRGRYDAGFAAIREARFARAKELGVIDPSWGLSPAAEDWSKVSDPAFEARSMEVYAAMVDSMDQGVGRIVNALKEHELVDNTLVLYLQDNGGCAELQGRRKRGTARADKPSLPPLADDYLQPDLVPKQTRDGYPVRQGVGVMPGPADTYIGYGRGWANVSNTPFREYKHWVHEGGISTPLIAHWPAGIAARGELCHEPGHLIDVMATCLDLAGVELPAERNGSAVKPLEGVSLRSAFDGGSIKRDEPIFFEHEGNRAIRDGRWKLVAKGPGGRWELYDMASDRTELNDLAERQPERVATMRGQWEEWAERTGVLPWPWRPAYNGR